MTLFLFVFLSLFSGIENRIISTSLGKLEGKQIDDFHLFKKIPFAKAPLGELRFQKPEKPDKWKGILDATEYGPACLSNSSTTNSPQKWIDEDCLHLNIFTSSQCLKSKNCPVVFYVHGGGLAYDSAVMYNDSYIWSTFTSRDIVFVIPAFRLGILSHFVIEDQSIAPNNVAIYDILLALEQVHKDIHNFGGDNKKVTLFGHSYGGSVSSALAFSTKINTDLRLFQRAVSMSSPRPFQTLEYQMYKTDTFVKKANCLPPITSKLTQRQKDVYSMRCLQKMDAMELLRIQRSLEDSGFPEFAFSVVREPLFQEVPSAQFMNSPKNIPMLTGVTIHEMDTTELKFLSAILDFKNPKEVEIKYRIDEKNGVYDSGNRTPSTQEIYIETYNRVTKLIENNIPVYLYEYSYPKHAKHTDDLFYLMGVHSFEMDENERKLKFLYQKMFTNFINFGEPGEGFELANLENSTYFNVFWNETSGEKPQMKSGFEKKIIDYWFKDMKEYDRQISEIKKRSPEFRIFSDTEISYYYSTSSILIISFFVFLSGFFVGKYFCVSRKDLYIKLEGTDFRQPYLNSV